MNINFVVRQNEYYDSVFLMRVASNISRQPGIGQVAVLMGTDRNKGLLREIGVEGPRLDSARPDDLIVAMQGDTPAQVQDVLEHLDEWLRGSEARSGVSRVRTQEQALAQQPNSNLAVISIPGEYAGREARKALEKGLNVFLFSSNVPVKEELELKRYARDHGLIVMGPDCGTAIVGGKGLGFANIVRRGPIAAIAAAGTGLQEFTCLVDRAGSGISHAIGVGARDLSDKIGGLSTLSALDALERDPSTQVIAVLSKPPGLQTLGHLIERIKSSTKPVVTCFLGLEHEPPGADVHFRNACTIDQAAQFAVQIATGKSSVHKADVTGEWTTRIDQELARLSPEQHYLRGLFAGGTLCYQAQQIFKAEGIRVYSNSPIPGNPELENPYQSRRHTIVDMGSELFTAGRPHPMIDSRLRRERLLAEARDPEVAVLLLDFILGLISASDPAGDLIDVIRQARRLAEARGGYLPVFASVCGTNGDAQGLDTQVRKLEDAGIVVLQSGAEAAHLCGKFISRLERKEPHADKI